MKEGELKNYYEKFCFLNHYEVEDLGEEDVFFYLNRLMIFLIFTDMKLRMILKQALY